MGLRQCLLLEQYRGPDDHDDDNGDSDQATHQELVAEKGAGEVLLFRANVKSSLHGRPPQQLNSTPGWIGSKG